MLKPKTILLLLLVADVLVPINRFSMFLQKKTLIYADISRKFQQLPERIEKLEWNDESFFKENAVPSVQNLHKEQEIQDYSVKKKNYRSSLMIFLKKNIKQLFLRDILIKLKSAVTVDSSIFLAYDVFNISARHTEEEQLHMVNTLTMFYGFQQSSTFKGRKNIASSLIDSDSITKEVMQKCFEEFQVQIKNLQDQCNKEIKNLVKEGKIKNPDIYKDEHSISPNTVYQV